MSTPPQESDDGQEPPEDGHDRPADGQERPAVDQELPDESWWQLFVHAVRGTGGDPTQGPLNRAIILLAVPMVLEMVMESVFAVVDIFFVISDDHVAVASAQLVEPFVLDVDVFYLKDFFQKIFQHQEQKDQASSRRRDAGDLRAPDKRNARRDIILRSTKIYIYR